MDEREPCRRNSKITAEKKSLFLDKVASGMRLSAASQAVGCSRQAISKHLNDDAEFKAAYLAAEQSVHEMVEDALIKCCLKGNTTAIIFYLTNRCQDRWADRRQPNVVQHTMSREEAVSLLKARGITEIQSTGDEVV